MSLPDPLTPLTAYRQFLPYLLVPKANGKTDKFPVNPATLEVATAHDPALWVTADEAAAIAESCGDNYGVAFVFTSNDPFFFIDIDNCLQLDGQWSPVAQHLCSLFPGAAIEISQSGSGLHIFGMYSGVAPDHGCKNATYGLECYTEKRFVALTGTSITGDVALDFTPQLVTTINTYFPPTVTSTPTDWRDGPVPEWSGPSDDDALIAKMLLSQSAASVFGTKASIKDLWEANEPALARAYPSLNDHDPYDRSSADNALANHLAFWTGKDHERIHRLMRRSALVRPKWDSHKTYLKEFTITGAVNSTGNVYSAGGSNTPPEPVELIPAVTEATLTVGMQFLSAEQVREYMTGNVYIQDRHRILTQGGAILKPEQYRATFGGYEFSMNADGDKTTSNAWEAFVENQAIRFPKVSTTCFRPEVAPGEIIQVENRTMVNTYVPINTKRRQGDPSPFLNHIVKLFPDERDRSIIMSYLAALVQYPGVKFQWCPMIQGGEGNGKTLIALAAAFAIGNRYTHMPSAQDMGNQFNGWLLEKLLIIVEEIFISHKRELMERMKPMITNEFVEVQQKGIDQITADNRSNWITFTNHKDAIIVSIDGRRYAIFYTPQQTAEDLVAWGMDGDYFPDLYDWLRTEGFEIINEYLHNYQIAEEFNPAGKCQRAPQTSSTAEAVELSVGSIEQEILEAVAQDRPGFAGGWVSSNALEKLLMTLRAERKIPINKRRILLQSLGYDWHPTLHNGRTNSVILPEGCKPRLFIKKGHIHRGLSTVPEVVRCYVDAQKYPDLGSPIDTQVNKV